MRTRIKVCGITDQAEALAIAGLGVDALGFIFVRNSPRYVSPELVRAIVAALPPLVAKVGVFMDQAAAEVNAIARDCGLTVIQLHGAESPDYCRLMALPVIKVFRVGPEARPVTEGYRQAAAAFLLDTYQPGIAGGTGQAFDWGLVNSLSLPGPLILAGGLNPDNIQAAIRQTRPYPVDVNSGVEIRPGRKDIDAVRRLLALASAE